ncbi:MAG: GNAT family N-acetyltransferase, partial [Actinomycetota bacterium]|nr:GNAT family N-acetyltransferase [Actinomycetota bacterium]
MIVVRRGTVDDAAEVVRLRALMLAAMGLDVGPATAPWRHDCAEAYRQQLADDGFGAFVIDGAAGKLAASALGWVDRRLPGPGSDGRVGHLANVCTDPAYRRRGLARAAVRAALE